MKNAYFILISLLTLTAHSSCPLEFNGKYIWLSENNISENSFLDNSLIVSLELVEACQKLKVSWQHHKNFQLNWINEIGDFKKVTGFNASQSLEISSEKLIEIYQDFDLEKTTTTEYKYISQSLLEIKVFSTSWKSNLDQIEINVFQKL